MVGRIKQNGTHIKEQLDEQVRARALSNRDHTGTVDAAQSRLDNSRNAATVDSTMPIMSMTELDVADEGSACPSEELARSPSTASAVMEETSGDDKAAREVGSGRRRAFTIPSTADGHSDASVI